MRHNEDNRLSPALGGQTQADSRPAIRAAHTTLTSAYIRERIEVDISPDVEGFELSISFIKGNKSVGCAVLEGPAILNLYDALGLLIAEVYSQTDEQGEPYPVPRRPGDELVDGGVRIGDRELSICTEPVPGHGLDFEFAEMNTDCTSVVGGTLTAAGCRAMLRACHAYLATIKGHPEA